jgi:tetratricopeptide (TPR) repeat protein
MISGRTASSSYTGGGKLTVCRLGPYVLLFLSLSSLTCLDAQEKICSHQERFASSTAKAKLAEAEATALLNKNPKNAKALTERGLARLGLGLLNAGVADFEQAVAVDPNSPETWASLAYGLWRQGQFEPALAAARKALERDSEYPSAHWYIGRLLLLTKGDVQEATRHLERALELNPGEAGIHLDLLMAYRTTGDLKRAWAQLRPLRVLLSPSDTRLLYVEGLLASDLGRSAFAIDRFHQALAIQPQMLEARNGLGVALVQAERWQEAIEVLSPLAREQPQSFNVAYLLALALHHAQRRPEAEQEVRRALRLNPGSTEAAVLLEKLNVRAEH